jgi:hypothetical protein
VNYKRVYVIENGTVRTLYADDLPKLGVQKISRASNVEPNANGTWDVILSDNPLNGKFAGHVVARNVARRDEAIRLEVEFINQNILGRSA